MKQVFYNQSDSDDDSKTDVDHDSSESNPASLSSFTPTVNPIAIELGSDLILITPNMERYLHETI